MFHRINTHSHRAYNMIQEDHSGISKLDIAKLGAWSLSQLIFFQVVLHTFNGIPSLYITA